VKRELLGHVGVDSGQIIVVDPCYVLGQDRRYDEVCRVGEKGGGGVTFPTTDGPGTAQAVVSPTKMGDGIYPVYVERDSRGRPLRLIIEF